MREIAAARDWEQFHTPRIWPWPWLGKLGNWLLLQWGSDHALLESLQASDSPLRERVSRDVLLGTVEQWSEGLATFFWLSLSVDEVNREGDRATVKVRFRTEQD